MNLSSDILTAFAKITKDDKKVSKETTVYGTIVEYSGSNYVRLDGSELLTPVSTTTDTIPGDRVAIQIKNHTATVTGNFSSPAARTDDVTEVSKSVAKVNLAVVDKAEVEDLNAEKARIDQLEASFGEFETLTTNKFTAIEGKIENLEVGSFDAVYANIDFSNIGQAAFEYFYSKSGLIKDVVIGDGTVSGHLAGVTISGDLIEGNTVVANKLVIQGEDGLYYKLNTDGMTIEAEQTDQNSLNGSIIKAKSITASKIVVSDLVAFGATIGGFNLTLNTIYSGVKESVDNTTRGIYLDKDGQIAFGDANNFVRYYEDSDGNYRLAVSAETIIFGVNRTNVATAISDASKTATDYMNLSSAGLVVGQNPSNPTSGNTLISSDGVTIRRGTTILAAFKAASRAASGITSATITSTDSTDSESDGVTNVKGTITSDETRANIYISTNGNPVYFPNGLETDKVLINNKSGIISNANILLNGSLVDKSGEGILTPLNSYGNMVIGYGRYEDGGSTHVYGTRVKAKTKDGFSASVDGRTAIDTNNSSGNATFGWHLYETNAGETNIYGYITSLFAKSDIRLSAAGNNIRFEGDLVPYSGNAYNLGTPTLSMHNIYISCNDDNTEHGIRFSNSSGSANAVGVNPEGYRIFGNTEGCTNIVTKSTTTTNTGYSFKVTCGDNPALVIGDNDARLLLFGGTDSTSRYIGSIAAYKRTYSSASNLLITENGIIGRSTSSSKRYKRDIEDLSIDVVKGLYNLPVRQFKYRDECISDNDERYGISIPGFIAEEVEEYFPIACDHILNENGEPIPEMWNSKIIVPALLKLIQDLNNRINKLEEVRA